MTSTDLEISNLKRQIEIQNSILEQILSEMKKDNELRENTNEQTNPNMQQTQTKNNSTRQGKSSS